MKKFLLLFISFFTLSAFGDLATQAGGGFEVESENNDWSVAMRGSSTVRAFNEAKQIEIMIDISNILPNSPLCVSNERIKDIKVNFNIYKVAQNGDRDWAKSFEKTRVYFSRPGGAEERKVYGSTLIKNDLAFKSGTVVNVGSLIFLSPFVCDEVDGLRMRVTGMKAGYSSLPVLDFTIKQNK